MTSVKVSLSFLQVAKNPLISESHAFPSRWFKSVLQNLNISCVLPLGLVLGISEKWKKGEKQDGSPINPKNFGSGGVLQSVVSYFFLKSFKIFL